MVSKLETLKTEVEELKEAEEELRRTEKELKEARRYKEAELKKLLLQKQLSSLTFRAPTGDSLTPKN